MHQFAVLSLYGLDTKKCSARCHCGSDVLTRHSLNVIPYIENRLFMKIKTIATVVASGLVSAVLFYGWVLYSVPRNAEVYLKTSPRMLDMIDHLQFKQFRDLPGYAGSLGRDNAKDSAREAAELEAQSWSDVSNLSYRLVNGTLLGKCLVKIHHDKENFLYRVAKYATAMAVDMRDVNQLFKDELAISNLMSECAQLASRAKSTINVANLFSSESNGSSQEDGWENKVRLSDKESTKQKNPEGAQNTASASNSNKSVEIAYCEKELKQFVIRQVESFTQANEDAIKKNCSSKTAEYLCFISKVNAAIKEQEDPNISNAQQGNFEQDCNLRTE